MLTTAFATADGVHVDTHFGRCARFDIYDVTAESVHLREIRAVATDDVGNEDHRLQARLDALAGCALLCVASIGPGAAAPAGCAPLWAARRATAWVERRSSRVAVVAVFYIYLKKCF